MILRYTCNCHWHMRHARAPHARRRRTCLTACQARPHATPQEHQYRYWQYVVFYRRGPRLRTCACHTAQRPPSRTAAPAVTPPVIAVAQRDSGDMSDVPVTCPRAPWDSWISARDLPGHARLPTAGRSARCRRRSDRCCHPLLQDPRLAGVTRGAPRPRYRSPSASLHGQGGNMPRTTAPMVRPPMLLISPCQANALSHIPVWCMPGQE